MSVGLASMAVASPVRVTHKDIAAETGYDKSTVSLALRESPKISSEAKKVIQEAATKLGYRPDPVIATLARQRWIRQERESGAVIAYLVDRSCASYGLQSFHFAMARERARQRGFALKEMNLSDYPDGAAASRTLCARGIRGVILPSMPNEADRSIREFHWDKFTVVCCSVGWLRTPFHVVTSDMFEATRKAWRELVARGYRRIGAALFRHTPVAIDDHTRLGASFTEQRQLDESHAKIPFLLCGPDDRKEFLRWFAEHRPDAIISLVPTMAHWLSDAGYSIPRQVGFLSLHAYPDRHYSGLAVEREAVARTAIDLLVSQMQENQWAIPNVQQVVHLKPRWIEGTTLRPRPGAVVYVE